MCRIGGRLRSGDASLRGVAVEIPPFVRLAPNPQEAETVLGGEFDWGGRLQKSNGGSQRYPQYGWQPCVECNGTRVLDCETDKSSRYESRA